MKANSILYRNLIIRSQVEYNAATQAVIFRCILETPSTGNRQGFTELEALLSALRAELTEIQNQILPPEQQKLKKPAAAGATNAVPSPAP